MEDQLLVVDEKKALEILGVKPSTLRSLVRSGMLEQIRYNRGRIRRYHLAELLALRASRIHNKTLVLDIRSEVISLASKVQTMARDLYLMAQQLGLPHIGYSPSDAVLSSLYQVALSITGSSGKKRHTVRFLNQWLSSVPLLTDQEYRRLAKLYPGEDYPWRSFYLATEEMVQSLGVHFNLESKEMMEVMRTRLILCLDRIRTSALVILAIKEPKSDPLRRLMEVVKSPLLTDPSFETQRVLQDLQIEKMDPDISVSEMLDTVKSNESIPEELPLTLDLRALRQLSNHQ